jgi:hypothetical protein
MPWLARSGVVAAGLLGAVPVALLAVATAWLASNLNDIAPRPRPAVLVLPTPTLPDDKNAFFALVGLQAEAGRDAAAVGRALWQVNLARAALPQRERLLASAHADLNQRDAAATGTRLRAVTGAPLYCKTAADGCVAEWLAQPEALAAQRALWAVQGARCDALFTPGMGFEELRQSPLHYAADLSPHVSGAAHCSRWWRSGAVLAWQQDQPQQALSLLVKAARMDAALLAGGQSLISFVLSMSMARDTQATVVGLALRDAAFARLSAPLLASALTPVPDAVLVAAARRALVAESAHGLTVMAELAECLDPGEAGNQTSAGWAERRFQQMQRWQCRNRIGFHPVRIQRLFDDFWGGAVAALDDGLPAAVTYFDQQQARAGQRGWQWHNTVGYILLDIATPSYGQYVRRAADLPLHTEAAALALAAAAQQVPAAERTAWAQRQPMSAALRERLRWDPSGQGFSVRTWYEDARTAPIESRTAIRFDWPAPPPG